MIICQPGLIMLQGEVCRLTSWQTGLVSTAGSKHYSSDKLCKTRLYCHLNKIQVNPKMSLRSIPQNQDD